MKPGSRLGQYEIVAAIGAGSLGEPLARGLAAANEKGIVHRGLRLENVFVTLDGPVTVLDLGPAKLIASRGVVVHRRGSTVVEATEAGSTPDAVGCRLPERVRSRGVNHDGGAA